MNAEVVCARDAPFQPRPVAPEEIAAHETGNGGFSKKTLALWGVPYPPPKGWKKFILAHGAPYDRDLHKFMKKKKTPRVQRQPKPKPRSQNTGLGFPLVEVDYD